MSYLDRDILGMYRNHDGPGPALMGADTLIGDEVYNHNDEELGDIKEIMLDMRTGQIAYAVLSFGGILGMGDKLFAVPWERLTLDTVNKRFLLNVDKDLLKNAPGFDKNNWPDMGSDAWNQQMEAFYGSGTRYSSGAMAGSRMPSGSDLRSGASLQSGSEGSLSGSSMSGSRAGTSSQSSSRSSLSDDDLNKDRT
ncbi:PRC-barrel domain-containing protein [Janthinobacterium sp. FW305-128]|uniref:PRC-barrel domain-containing protein n=1 Tax=Janthinobacterium sp. FW305-128 TaxID=2775055 RepID=UPI001E380CCA|nr:PRC-barrel domain-containing protein [Janthinobacterium sp. FW305-128]MCC7682737.1 PRC-barrel domain-containing protein [Janthinobacterium sp. FW305-128]